MSGTLVDTYVAALQQGFADVPEGATRLGVVRRPMPWFHAQVHDNWPALAPPAPLLDEVKARHTSLKAEGMTDSTAHNAALDAVDYADRYRSHLETTAAAQDAIETLLDWLEGGRDVALVCYENTDKKRCHRTLLRTYLERRLEE